MKLLNGGARDYFLACTPSVLFKVGATEDLTEKQIAEVRKLQPNIARLIDSGVISEVKPAKRKKVAPVVVHEPEPEIDPEPEPGQQMWPHDDV